MFEKMRNRELGDGKWGNKEFTVTNGGTTVTLYFQSSGTESSNDTTNIYARYFNFGRGAFHINIRPDKLIQITQIKLVNGPVQSLSDSITVQTTGWKSNYGEIDYIVINVPTSATQIKCEAS